MVTPEREAPHVLIVDPRDRLQGYYAGCMVAVGFHVACAQSHEQGLSKASRLAPDIVLTECSADTGTGVAFCQRLRARLSTSRIPVLGLVAADDVTTARAAIEAGCTVLEAPCSPEQLLVEIVSTVWPFDPPIRHTPTVEHVTQMLGQVLREHAQLVERQADLTASAHLWANWYERTLTRAKQGRDRRAPSWPSGPAACEHQEVRDDTSRSPRSPASRLELTAAAPTRG